MELNSPKRGERRGGEEEERRRRGGGKEGRRRRGGGEEERRKRGGSPYPVPLLWRVAVALQHVSEQG